MTTKEQFLLANRKLGILLSSFSIAASWIWAPALFVSSQQAYLNGWRGLAWFVIPNVLCLILFSFFAVKIRDRLPKGFTISQLMLDTYSIRVQNLYWVTLIGLITCAFAAQLLAGSLLLSKVYKLDFTKITIFMAMIPLFYSWIAGLRVAVLTDFIKLVTVFILGGLLLFKNINTPSEFVWNFDGIKPLDNLTLFLTFGLPTTIGLLSGPFGDQSFWQRAFATTENKVRYAFIFGALIFGIVPLSMGFFGFLANSLHITVNNSQMVPVYVIKETLPPYALMLFVIVAITCLVSVLDSKLCAISSIAGHDIAERVNIDSITVARLSMILLTILAVFIANITDLKIVHLFLIYGSLRSSTLIPTLATLLNYKVSEKGIYVGIFMAIIVGLPMFSYGTINNQIAIGVTGSLLTLLLPLVGILIYKNK